MGEKLVIIDGNSLLNRAFYALPPMTNSKGQPTGAIYGFTTMLFKIFNEIKPNYIGAAFDRKAPTFRHIAYKDYKAGRKKMPDELGAQFEPVKELLRAFNIGIYEIDGYEADDIIGTITKRYESPELEVVIFTGDRDALQLVSPYTKVMITKKGITETETYDLNYLKEKYNLNPKGIIDLKGLMGDSSDNIPGVPGVGEKTALKLLSQFGTLENVFENIDNISGKKLNENLRENKETAYFSKKLATINVNVPIETDLSNMRIKDYDYIKIRNLFEDYEFKSLINKIPVKDEKIHFNMPQIQNFNEDSNLIKTITSNGIFNFIINESGMIFDGGILAQPSQIEYFKEIFESDSIVKNTYDGKYAYNFLKGKGIELKNLNFDGEIASYLLNPSESKYDMLNLLNQYSGINTSGIDADDKNGIAALYVQKLDDIKRNMLTEINKHGMNELFEKIEMPLIEVLSSMECLGFKVDAQILHDIGFELSEEIDKLTGEIYDIAGSEFNINSPKQLGVILFEKLNLPVIKKTKTGYSTDAEVLEELSDKHEIVDKIINYRQLVKLKSTYTDGLISCIGKDGRIHSSFNQTVTATGRISSTEPNLQNIPIKMEQGRRIRKAFVPENDEYVIISGDYSQIELRVLAHISQDKSLINSFVNNEDIHRRTASEVFGIPMDEVTPLQRSRAKAVNFGIIYGQSDYGLSRELKISRKEAKSYIDNYFKRYSGVKDYLDSAILDAKDKGYVTTLMNRIRYIPEINSTNKNVKKFGERLAMNTPIQGSAADIIKIAMVKVYSRIKKEKLKSRLILQVHDELIVEAYKNEIDYMKQLIKSEMENAVKLSVPLVVDINVGNNWYEAK
ncbi:MAG TPA: DNA polymerase I [Clostridiaceae bacterium]|nr:DNA polymerase I [Clostridiaceae bacterium]HBF76676.1 DNA polymerase I [Clostridiaceae bacterium]HBG39632.1 DNA polymerase I [Clostridiaceae bacterium]